MAPSCDMVVLVTLQKFISVLMVEVGRYERRRRCRMTVCVSSDVSVAVVLESLFKASTEYTGRTENAL